jgi:hypothetical protein
MVKFGREKIRSFLKKDKNRVFLEKQLQNVSEKEKIQLEKLLKEK